MNNQSQSASKLGPLQYVLVGIIGIAVVAGAVLCAVAPKTFSFKAYETQALPQLGQAVALLGIGKGIHLGAQSLNLTGLIDKAASNAGQSILQKLEKGDVFGALGEFESAVPSNLLPSDHDESVRPAPQPPSDGGSTATGGGTPEAPPADTSPPAADPPPPAPQPLSAQELAMLRDLQARAATTGQE